MVAQAALGVVASLALASAVNYYRTVGEKNRAYQDPWMTSMIGIQAERLREVIAMVPAEAVVGYISDSPLDQGRDAARFAGARYALAPRLVVPHDSAQKQDWVLGNFSKPVDVVRIQRENRVKLVKDFGSGVMVFRSK